jgi:hypothetical protein
MTLPNQQVSETCNGEIQSFFSYLHDVLPSRIREEITKQISSPNQVSSADTLDCTVRNCLNQTRNEWHQVHDVQPADHQNFDCQSWDDDPSTSWLSYPNTPSSCFDQNLSLTGLGLDHLTPRHQTEMVLPSWTWEVPFQNGNAESASIDPRMSSYRSVELLDCSRTSTMSDGLTWLADTSPWASAIRTMS